MIDPTALAEALLLDIEEKNAARAERMKRIIAAYEKAYDVASTPEHKLAVMANYGEGALSILKFGETNYVPALIAEVRRLRTHAETSARDARRKAFEEAAQWQPIETAPKDGTKLILAKIGLSSDQGPFEVWWASSGSWSARWQNWNDGIEPCGLADPNYWMPMPALAAALQTGEEGS